MAASEHIAFTVINNTDTNLIGAQRVTIQDKQGYMWFGGDNGLARFDGYSAKVFRYNAEIPSSISSNLIYDIIIDRDGVMWVATSFGLNQFDPEYESFTSYTVDDTQESVSNDIRSIMQAQDGRIWLGTSIGIAIFDPVTKSFTVDEISALPDNLDVRDIVEDDSDNVWIGTAANGAFRVNPTNQQVTHFAHNEDDNSGLSGPSVVVMHVDRQGSVWIGTASGGLNLFDKTTESFSHFKHNAQDSTSIGSNFIRGIYDDTQGNFWIATDGGGLSRFDRLNGRFESYKHQPGMMDSLRSDKIRSIYEDAFGNLWFGHFPFGLTKLDRQAIAFRHYRHNPLDENSLSDNSMLAIAEESPGVIWVGTENGLNLVDLDSGDTQRFMHDPLDQTSLPAPPALAIEKTRDGVWVGTWSGGLSLLDKETGTFTYFQHDRQNSKSISGDHIWVVYEDSNNDLWIGTETAGLNKYDRENNDFIHYPTGNDPATDAGANWVSALLEDSRGNFWVGTYFGLALLNRDTGDIEFFVEDPNRPDSIKGNHITSIIEDAQGHLWIGTHGSGINKKSPSTHSFTTYDMSHGLADNVVYGIVEDKNGNIWFATANGLSRFNPETEQFFNFYKSSGLAGDVFNRPAYAHLSSGKLAFGSTDGLTIVDPDAQTSQRVSPPLVFNDFQVLNESVTIASDSVLPKALGYIDEITLTHEHSVFSIGFVELNYRNSEDDQYSYKLAGFDENWSPPSSNRLATYTNLDPGTYTFTVKVVNNQENAAHVTRSINITILPAPWRSPLAYFFYSLAAFLLLLFLGSQHLQKLRASKRLELALWGSGDEFWEVDMALNKIFRRNPMTELNHAEIDDWNDAQLEQIHPEDKPFNQRAIQLIKDGEQQELELAYRKRTVDNEWVWLLDRGRVTKTDSHGTPLVFTGTTKNIQQLKATETALLNLNIELENRVQERTKALEDTAKELQKTNNFLKRAQKQLVESEKMVSLGSMVAGVSHELNTPLGISTTALSILQSQLSALYELVKDGSLSRSKFEQFQSDANESVALVEKNLERAAKIVETFKSVATMQPNDVISANNVSKILLQAISDMQMRYTLASDSIVFDATTDIQIRTYSSTLESIVVQLLENAAKHAYDRIEDFHAFITVSQVQDEIIITLQDNGKGMDKEMAKRIFDPFYTTNRGDNLGLGMHIVYNQVTHVLHGKIKCKSEIGVGTQIIIKLPAQLDVDVTHLIAAQSQ
ncbi:two-component regulator propeller domain-containing protein [Alteromonas sp. ASW11-36]|uniref:histidine kinase n=1 Tax=Alteromonas arenosi TaxID=3055817 RepID=A0ABT7SW05_9ALTE|nr:two-component regulator propeller domain-containing protein [Alteromonas sp. ASW11-36]